MITVIIPIGTRLIIAETEQVIETIDVIKLTLDLDLKGSPEPKLKEVEHFRVGDDLGDSDCPLCGGEGTVPGESGDVECVCREGE